MYTCATGSYNVHLCHKQYTCATGSYNVHLCHRQYTCATGSYNVHLCDYNVHLCVDTLGSVLTVYICCVGS